MHDLKRTSFLGLTLLAALAPSCSSGGDGSAPPSTVTLSLTDAPSDELSSFRVEVESFRLRRANGAVAGVLAEPVTIDLVSLTDLGQVLNVKSVPAGLYTSAEVTFDFSDAVCVIHGQPTAATILDSAGNPLGGRLTLPIELGQGALNAVSGKHRLLELDFDLDQSLVVDAARNTVSLEPVLVLRVDPHAPKQLLVVGRLASVDPLAATFVVDVQTLGGRPAGTLELEALALSVYQIDGVPRVGAPGLAALGAKGAGTWLQVYGAVDPDSARLLAFHVAAGTGTFHGGSDIVEGHVLARSSGAGTSATLTVRGHSSDAAHTTFQFNRTFTVTTALASTKVLKVGAPTSLDLDAVNVGQRVRVFGSLSGTSMDATAPDDVIRLQPTRVYGHAAGAPAGGTLTMALARVGLLPQGDFSWGDSGASPPDPAAFALAVAGLGDGLGIVAGTAVEARGYLAPLDDPDEDLVALSLANLDRAPSLLFVRDVEGVGLDLTLLGTLEHIEVHVSGAAATGEAAVIDKGFAGALPLPAAPTPTIRPPGSGLTLYFLTDKVLGGTTLYVRFADFSEAAGLAIAQGAQVGQVAALGAYDEAGNMIHAPLAGVLLR